MIKYHFISRDPHIDEYIAKMATWIVENSSYSYEQTYKMFRESQLKINELFEPYPETIFHDDPAKWAELLAINWGIIEERELEFV